MQISIGDGGEHGFKHNGGDHEYMGTNKAQSLQISIGDVCMLKNILYANLQLLFILCGKIHQILISQKNNYEFIILSLINLNNPDGKVEWGVENLLGARWEHTWSILGTWRKHGRRM
jgi:hypothetical protein